VGRLVPEKGFHDLIDAFGQARTNSDDTRKFFNDWRLVIVGDADHEDDYSKGLKAKSENTDYITLTGRLSGQSLEELYSHAGLFVLPSYHEGLPIVLLEALSYGLSCIVSDIPANREVGLSEDRYFKPGGIDRIAAKIIEYMQKPLDAGERKRQIDMIGEKYDWEKIAKETIKVYYNATVNHAGAF
jgi:glycosyltransferase involved in cell wall biosynthesis